MYFWKAKDGTKLSFKEFIKKFKSGIAEVTPKQKLESSIFFQGIMTLGFFFGLCVALYNYKTMWWLAIILFGGLGINIIQYKSIKQQLGIFKKIEEEFERQENEPQN